MRYGKYNSKKVKTPDGKFDSEREYKHWLELKNKEEAGEISNLRRQVDYQLIPRQVDDNGKFVYRPVYYVADFVFKDADGEEVVADSKGFETPEFKIKAKLFYFIYGKKIQKL